MIDAAEALSASVAPTFYARATPSGVIEAQAYHSMLGELLAGIRSAMPVDAVALALHGAGVVDGMDDLEGHLCQAVRSLVGPEVKIVATLDLHGNVTQAMADATDMCFGVHFYPHTDGFERGREALNAIPRLLSGEWNPVIHVEYVPMLVPAAATSLHPAKSVNELCWLCEQRSGILDCTFFHGFPYTDTPQAGAAVMTTANRDQGVAQEVSREVAAWIIEHREHFRRETLTPQQAIAKALAVAGRPVVINDTADNPGGGAPGDATHLLRAMIDSQLEEACFAFIADPGVVAQAHAAGVGATIKASLGGKYDEFHGAPLDLEAYVKCLTDGRFVLTTPQGRGSRVDLGKMARLVVGGLDVLVSSVRSQVLDPEVFLLHGIDVTRYRVVALKSSAHFRGGFGHIAKEIITADSPGLTTLDVSCFPRKRTPRPIWPLDDIR
jgi:microcystin degradation protein MlrC